MTECTVCHGTGGYYDTTKRWLVCPDCDVPVKSGFVTPSEQAVLSALHYMKIERPELATSVLIQARNNIIPSDIPKSAELGEDVEESLKQLNDELAHLIRDGHVPSYHATRLSVAYAHLRSAVEAAVVPKTITDQDVQEAWQRLQSEDYETSEGALPQGLNPIYLAELREADVALIDSVVRSSKGD